MFDLDSKNDKLFTNDSRNYLQKQKWQFPIFVSNLAGDRVGVHEKVFITSAVVVYKAHFSIVVVLFTNYFYCLAAIYCFPMLNNYLQWIRNNSFGFEIIWRLEWCWISVDRWGRKGPEPKLLTTWQTNIGKLF